MSTGDKNESKNFSAAVTPRTLPAERPSAQPERAARLSFASAAEWQRKIAESRLRHCLGIDRAVARGETVAAATRRRRSSVRGGSAITHRRLYYLWRRNGRDAAVLLPRTMQRPGFALTAQQRRNIRLMLYNAGVVSLVQLYKATVGKGGPSYSAFVRSFSATERALFRRVFLARIRYWHTEQKFAAFLSRPERTFYGGRK